MENLINGEGGVFIKAGHNEWGCDKQQRLILKG